MPSVKANRQLPSIFRALHTLAGSAIRTTACIAVPLCLALTVALTIIAAPAHATASTPVNATATADTASTAAASQATAAAAPQAVAPDSLTPAAARSRRAAAAARINRQQSTMQQSQAGNTPGRGVAPSAPAARRTPSRPSRPSHRATSPIAPASAPAAPAAPAAPDTVSPPTADAHGNPDTAAAAMPDSIDLGTPQGTPLMVTGDSIITTPGGDVDLIPIDTVMVAARQPAGERKYTFNPDPARAVWMSALFPGLGQLYNRRYWKLPIVVGAFMGLGYATSWNNTMLRDYTTAYSDIMDNDPTTRSYMDFFAPTVKESDLDRSWLTNVLRTRKNYYRRNRDLCIICMIAVYAVAMVDAYVDAQLAHFDISPDLSMEVMPTLMNGDVRSATSRPALGLYWALNF